LACGIGLFALGCSSGDDGDDGDGSDVTITEGPLSGTVGGQAWTVARAETDAFLSEGEPDYWTDLYGRPGTACESSGLDQGDHVILQAPREPGEYPLSLSYNATFVIEGDITDNLVATTGRVVIDEVTSSVVRGGAYLYFDADNTVNGQFEITICP
jgi:hypothetical protein